MSIIGAGVALLIVGVLVYILANPTAGIVVGIIGLGLLLYALLVTGRRRV